MRLALAQMNSVVGDLAGNRNRILELLAQSREAGADRNQKPVPARAADPDEHRRGPEGQDRERSHRSSIWG